MPGYATEFKPKFFRLEKLAEGVFAGIGHYGEGNIANTGIIDLGESVLVVDSFELVQVAQELRDVIGHLIGKPVSFVVNTHAHDDHFVGNGVFGAETRIVSTHHNRELIAAYAREIGEDREELVEEVDDLKRQLDEAPDEATRQRLAPMLTRFSLFLEAFDEMVVRPPDVAFDERLVIHGAQRRAEVLSYGVGHTSSDVIVYLPDDRIVFTGDLVTVQTQPYLADGNPDMWRIALAKIGELDFAALVPGHGGVGTKADVLSIRQYLDTMEQVVRRVVDEGGTADDAANVPVPPVFEKWSGGSYTGNMRFLFERLSGS